MSLVFKSPYEDKQKRRDKGKKQWRNWEQNDIGSVKTMFILILLQDDVNLPPSRYSDLDGPIIESSIPAGIASADGDELKNEI